MAGQTTILSADSTQATSSDVVVAAGSVATVGLFASAGGLPAEAKARVYIDTPGADLQFAELDSINRAVVISGPGTFRVQRICNGASFGVFSET